MFLKEFEGEREGILDPKVLMAEIENIPKTAVSCYSKNLIDEITANFPCEKIGVTKSANGHHSIYKIRYKEKDFCLYMSPVGASASAAACEDMFARGIERLVLFGSCGCLKKEIEDLAVIIPTYALRDEGTSYHYLEASDEVEVNSKEDIEAFKDILSMHGYSYTEGKVWTTDAPYRETREKMERRRGQGAVCVDMECSAMASVAKFRNKQFFQFFYGADNLDGVKWDKRSLSNSARLDKKLKIALLALEMAYRIND